VLGLLDNWADIASESGFGKGRRPPKMGTPYVLLPSIMSTAPEPSLLLRVIGQFIRKSKGEEPRYDHR
jgi:hypothetical protein